MSHHRGSTQRHMDIWGKCSKFFLVQCIIPGSACKYSSFDRWSSKRHLVKSLRYLRCGSSHLHRWFILCSFRPGSIPWRLSRLLCKFILVEGCRLKDSSFMAHPLTWIMLLCLDHQRGRSLCHQSTWRKMLLLFKSDRILPSYHNPKRFWKTIKFQGK